MDNNEIFAPLTRQWYLITTKSSEESAAYHRLVSLGFTAYYPRVVRRMRSHGKRVRRIFPLFPRYIFLQLTVGIQDIHPVRQARSVRSIVRFGSEYAIVPDRIVIALQGRADSRTGLHFLDERRLLPHQEVRITDGTFGGLEGIFLRDSGSERVVVLLSLMGQDTQVKIPERLVEPLAPRAIRAA